MLLVNETGIKIYAHGNVLKINTFNQHLANTYQRMRGGNIKDGGADTDGGDIETVTGMMVRDLKVIGMMEVMITTVMKVVVTDCDQDDGDRDDSDGDR